MIVSFFAKSRSSAFNKFTASICPLDAACKRLIWREGVDIRDAEPAGDFYFHVLVRAAFRVGVARDGLQRIDDAADANPGSSDVGVVQQKDKLITVYSEHLVARRSQLAFDGCYEVNEQLVGGGRE